jgi:hypothetical protein
MSEHIFARFTAVTALLAAGLALLPFSASAETVAKTVQRNKTAAIVPIFAFDRESCDVYAVTDVTITAKPAHGTTGMVTHSMPIGKSAGICAGTIAKMQWLLYQPARNYSGTDRISISWTLPNEMDHTQHHRVDYTFVITVK